MVGRNIFREWTVVCLLLIISPELTSSSRIRQLNECAPLFWAVGCRGGTRNFITVWSRQVKYRSECGPGLPGHSVLWLKRGHSGNRCLGNGSQQCNCLQSETISGWTFHLVYSCLPRLFLKCVSFPTIVDSPILYKLDVL